MVLADTHLRDGAGRDLPAPVWAAIERCDLVLHAGDVTGADLLDRIAERRPVRAVLGNNDHGLVGVLPERWVDTIDGVRIAMVHDTGARQGRGARVERWFPDADLVVYGHSHEPFDGTDGGVRLFNPGSPTQRRRAPYPTFGLIEISAAKVVSTAVKRADGAGHSD